MRDSSNTTNSLAHTKWNCKYHIVFAPKYRRKVFYDEHRLEVREILRKLCEWKGVEIIEGEVCPDHVHILVSIPPKMSVSVFMGYLKGKSASLLPKASSRSIGLYRIDCLKATLTDCLRRQTEMKIIEFT